MYPAHIRVTDAGERLVQSAKEHCVQTARYAKFSLCVAGLGDAAYLAGLLHDCGKFKAAFARYLEDPNGVRGSVNHSFAGCRLLLERYHGEMAENVEDLTAELLAFAVGGHHGLFDCIDEHGQSGFLHRSTSEGIDYSESNRNFLSECVSLEELDALFARANGELLPVYEKIAALSGDNGEEYDFYMGLLARLLLSAVIEGDRRDTAEFMGGFSSPVQNADLPAFWTPYLERVEEKLAQFDRNDPIRQARGRISDLCRDHAEKPGGIYRLNVPTGGGKTLSFLRYALAHARKWGKRRLIFTSPLLSILEQNAAVLRSFIGDDKIILEHHSNLLPTKEDGSLDPRELAVESWNAPIIITTLVQLLNTLFDGRTTAIRRFQGLCGSIIVIDEVQTVPPKMLTLFNLAVDFLSEVCGATVLLCSATQPSLHETPHPLRRCAGEVVPYDEALWEPFRRTVITDAGYKTLEEIGDFASEVLADVQSLLVVCNCKDEAEFLFGKLKERAAVSCHLSASMCIAHRRNTLERLNAALNSSEKCLCVSTQVIEAGVDISFERVIRLSAGMDSVIQSAGRCNRHGERAEPVPVYVVSCLGEKLERLREIKDAKNATTALLDAYRRDPARFGNDLSSDGAIDEYYRKLYGAMPEDYQDYYVEKHRATIFDLLSANYKYYDENAPHVGKFLLNQGFKLAGKAFQVFDNDSRDLVVPYGEGEALIAELSGRSEHDPAFLADWLRRAKPYTVAVYDYQLRLLGNAVTEYGGIAVLAPAFYDEQTGLVIRPKENEFLEV